MTLHKSVKPILLSCLMVVSACFIEVSGDRHETGECPTGETCSSTIKSLTFIGKGFFDSQLPVLASTFVGGTNEIGLVQEGVEPLEEFDFSVEDPSIFSLSRGTNMLWNTLGNTGIGGEQDIVSLNSVRLSAIGEGTTFLRITDPKSGELYDRIPLTAEKGGVVVMPLDDTVLHAGTEQLLGVRLKSENGIGRIIDTSLTLSANTTIQPENMYWDCFTFQVPEDQDEVTFVATTGQGLETTHTIPVIN